MDRRTFTAMIASTVLARLGSTPRAALAVDDHVKGPINHARQERADDSPQASHRDTHLRGVRGDGITDDTEAFQAALNEAGNREAGNGVLRVGRPSKSYRISKPLIVPPGVKAVIGQKAIITFAYEQSQEPSFDESLLIIRDSKSLLLQGLELRYGGTYDMGSSYAGYISGIYVEDSENLVIDQVEAWEFNRAGINIATGNGRGYTSNVIVRNCHLHHNRVGNVLFGNTEGLLITHNTLTFAGIKTDRGTGYGVAGWSSKLPKNTRIVKNVCSFNCRKGIDLHSGATGEIVDNVCEGNLYYGIYVANNGKEMGNWVISRNVITQMVDQPVEGGAAIHVGFNRPQSRTAGPTTVLIESNVIDDFNEANGLTPLYVVVMYLGTLREGHVTVRNNRINVGKVSRLIQVDSGGGGGYYDLYIEGNHVDAVAVTSAPFALLSTLNRIGTFVGNYVTIRRPISTGNVYAYAATAVPGEEHLYAHNRLNVSSRIPWNEDPLLIRHTSHEKAVDNCLNGSRLRDWDGHKYVAPPIAQSSHRNEGC